MQHIGTYNTMQEGPLVVVLGAIHGNEPAGVLAIESILQQLQEKAIPFRGSLVGLIANSQAYAQKVRFIDQDMNRIWAPRFLDNPSFEKSYEIEAAKNILQFLHKQIRKKQYTSLVLLDIHTTSAEGASFLVPGRAPDIYKLLSGASIPVVEGLLDYIHDSTLHYFDRIFQGKACLSLGLEAGSHLSPQSVDTAINFIYHLLNSLKCIPNPTLDDWTQKETTQTYYKLHSVQKIEDPAAFKMLPGFENFQPIKKGQPLANYHNEVLHAPIDGYILMPLYQKQGNEGFFLLAKQDKNATLPPAIARSLS